MSSAVASRVLLLLAAASFARALLLPGCGSAARTACARRGRRRTPVMQQREEDDAVANTEGVGKLLSVGERIQRGTSSSWVNPAYWNRQFVTASHITNNVPEGSAVIELGKDAKNLYYVNEPESMTLIVPPSNQNIEEGPLREAAA